MKKLIKISAFVSLLAAGCVGAAAADSLELKTVTFSFDDRDYSVSFNCPREFKDSVIQHDNMISVILGADNNKLTISYTGIKLDDASLNFLKNKDNFTATVLKPFSDKENLLYGRYSLIKESFNDDHFSIELTGFLKKPADEYLPDAENHFYQRTDLLFNDFHRLSCQVAGRQNEAAATKLIFNANINLCKNVIESFAVTAK